MTTTTDTSVDLDALPDLDTPVPCAVDDCPTDAAHQLGVLHTGVSRCDRVLPIMFCCDHAEMLIETAVAVTTRYSVCEWCNARLRTFDDLIAWVRDL